MQKLNFPPFQFTVKQEENKTFILDEIRKKYLVLTPEEWVRQHCVKFLNEYKNYPLSLLSIEKQISVNRMSRRCDIVAYHSSGKPKLIVECKAPNIKITQDVFNQIAAYNTKLQVEYLFVTNGLQHYCCKIDLKEKKVDFIKDLPEY